MAKKKKKAEKPAREFTRRQLSLFQRQKRRQRIIFISGVSIIAAVILIVLLGWFLGEFLPTNRTVIQVGDAKFSAGYYIDLIKILGADEDPGKVEVLAGNAAREIEQMELIRRGAGELGISVSDKEAKKVLEENDISINDATIDAARNQLLQERLRNEYLRTQVPESDKQVYIMAMLVESEGKADEIRASLLNSGNFTSLAEEFAHNYYSKNVNKGDFGWHPEAILNDMLGSSVAVEYAFNGEVGALSEPLRDGEIYKQIGYWLIKVLEKQYEEEAQVQALLISSEEEAEAIRARLEAGEDLATLAGQYSHYSPSKEKGGELGLVAQEEVSPAFDEYVFNAGVEMGVWSEPIRDDTYWTQGGYWLIKVVDKDGDRKLSTEDRNKLIDKAFNDWVGNLWAEYGAEIDDSRLTGEVQEWVIERVLKEVESSAR